MSEQLTMPRALADEMVRHCLEGRPHEACGILGGRDGLVTRVFRMSNADRSPVRYSLEPKEQLAVYNTLDAEGLELSAVFHSHTRTEAHPSPTDVRLAAEEVPYLIVSLAADPPAMRAWRILKQSWTDERGSVQEIDVVVAD